jgi:hypothetical protein
MQSHGQAPACDVIIAWTFQPDAWLIGDALAEY